MKINIISEANSKLYFFSISAVAIPWHCGINGKYVSKTLLQINILEYVWLFLVQ